MAVSTLQIWNLALNFLGMETLTTSALTNPSAKACNLFFETCRDDVYSEYRAAFATVKEALVLVDDTVIGWDYVYQYPTKCARVWNVFNEGSVEYKEEQEFEVVYLSSQNKRVICSNLESAYAEYTYKVADVTMFDAKFVLALSYKLATAIAPALLGADSQKATEALNLYLSVISEAKRLNAQEKIKKPTFSSGTVDSRG